MFPLAFNVMLISFSAIIRFDDRTLGVAAKATKDIEPGEEIQISCTSKPLYSCICDCLLWRGIAHRPTSHLPLNLTKQLSPNSLSLLPSPFLSLNYAPRSAVKSQHRSPSPTLKIPQTSLSACAKSTVPRPSATGASIAHARCATPPLQCEKPPMPAASDLSRSSTPCVQWSPMRSSSHPGTPVASQRR